MYQKTDKTTIDDAENLDLVMLMHNLLQYSQNYSIRTGSSWFYSKYEATNFNPDIVNDDNLKPFKYKTKLQNTVAVSANGILKSAATAVLLKYLNNF